MPRLSKWKKGICLALMAGIIALAVYGIHNTVQSYQNIQQAQTALALTTGSSDTNASFGPGGTLCSYYGCSGCGGCVNRQFQQSTSITEEYTSTNTIN